jgi:outer membrane protein assembly factor BamB
MSLDQEMRALERVARARPDDGAAQLGLASVLERLGRSREAVEAFVRAAASEPGDLGVQRALGGLPWWNGPRGQGGTRFLPVEALRAQPELVVWKRLGDAHALGGIALGRGVIVVRILDAPGEWRLLALTLATGRELWARESREEASVLAAAPPLTSEDAVLDAILFAGARGTLVLRVRAREAATGKERWCTSEELPADVGPRATFECAAATEGRLALGIGAGTQGKHFFEPILRVLDVATGNPLERTRVRGLNDLALDGDRLYLSTAYDSARRVEARAVPDGPRWQSARGERTSRLAVQRDHVVAATETSLVVLDRESGSERFRQGRRFGGHQDAFVVAPRVIVASWQRERTVAVDLVTGNRLWADEPVARSLAAADETLYAVSADGTVVKGLDLTDGLPLWSVDLTTTPLGHRAAGGVHKLAVAPSRIVGLTKAGALFVLGPAG